MANLKNTSINDAQFRLPVGDTAARPGSPNARQIRFNTETGKLEQFRPGVGDWIAPNNTGVIATGGDSVYDVDVEGTTYRVHVFTSTGTSTFEVLQSGEVDVLVVGGGGGGGATIGGGGGAGGFVYKESLFVSPQTYSITVGDGGLGGYEYSFNSNGNSESGLPGDDTTAFGFTALGGGGGSGWEFGPTPTEGGSGGGGSAAVDDQNDPDRAGQAGIQPGTNPTADIDAGNAGANGDDGSIRAGGGGGGAGAPGEVGVADFKVGNGGIGLAIDITGVNRFYAGGGGGGDDSDGPNPNPGGFGGLGGGGRGGITGGSATDPGVQGQNGAPNTGGGGGSGSYTGRSDNDFRIGGKGGSGIVVVRYPLRQENPVTAAGRAVGDGLVLDLDFAKPTVYSGSGSVVTDSRLNGIEGDINGPSFVNPRTHRSAFEFDGSNDFINIGPAGIETKTYTVTGWIYKTSTNTGNAAYVISGGYGGDTDGITIETESFQTSGDIRLSAYGGNKIYYNGQLDTTGDTGSSFNLNEWLHFAVDLTVPTIDGGDHNIGRNNNDTNHFKGLISMLKIYNRSLTDTEIEQDFNATRWRFGV